MWVVQVCPDEQAAGRAAEDGRHQAAGKLRRKLTQFHTIEGELREHWCTAGGRTQLRPGPPGSLGLEVARRVRCVDERGWLGFGGVGFLRNIASSPGAFGVA